MSNPTPQTRPFTRPSFPMLHSSTSSASSSYQSRSSVPTLGSPSPSSSSSAPLPSPSLTQQQTDGFFGSLNQQQQQQQQQHQYQFQQQQQRQFAPQNQTSQAAPTSNYDPNRQGAGNTAAETSNYLNDFALLAEAAKRAQMACLMRDMEGVEL